MLPAWQQAPSAALCLTTLSSCCGICLLYRGWWINCTSLTKNPKLNYLFYSLNAGFLFSQQLAMQNIFHRHREARTKGVLRNMYTHAFACASFSKQNIITKRCLCLLSFSCVVADMCISCMDWMENMYIKFKSFCTAARLTFEQDKFSLKLIEVVFKKMRLF